MRLESEGPYAVAAITDLANNYSSEHFRFAVGHCRDVIAKVIAEDNRSDQQIARVRILKYLDIQLFRAVRWIEDDADLMAGVMRSLIELKFWAKFVSER
jgi:malonyl CoA-acyl carrier protein transacylase